MSQTEVDQVRQEVEQVAEMLKKLDDISFSSEFYKRAAVAVVDHYANHYLVFHEDCGGVVNGRPEDLRCSECDQRVTVKAITR